MIIDFWAVKLEKIRQEVVAQVSRELAMWNPVYMNELLNHVNHYRHAVGLEILKELYPGYPGYPDYNPISRSLGDTCEGVYDEDAVFQDKKYAETAARVWKTQYNGKEVLLPRIMVKFSKVYDDRKIPELIEEGGMIFTYGKNRCREEKSNDCS